MTSIADSQYETIVRRKVIDWSLEEKVFDDNRPEEYFGVRKFLMDKVNASGKAWILDEISSEPSDPKLILENIKELEEIRLGKAEVLANRSLGIVASAKVLPRAWTNSEKQLFLQYEKYKSENEKKMILHHDAANIVIGIIKSKLGSVPLSLIRDIEKVSVTKLTSKQKVIDILNILDTKYMTNNTKMINAFDKELSSQGICETHEHCRILLSNLEEIQKEKSEMIGALPYTIEQLTSQILLSIPKDGDYVDIRLTIEREKLWTFEQHAQYIRDKLRTTGKNRKEIRDELQIAKKAVESSLISTNVVLAATTSQFSKEHKSINEQKVCFNYRDGNCRYGDACKFKHIDNNGGNGGRSSNFNNNNSINNNNNNDRYRSREQQGQRSSSYNRNTDRSRSRSRDNDKRKHRIDEHQNKYYSSRSNSPVGSEKFYSDEDSKSGYQKKDRHDTPVKKRH